MFEMKDILDTVICGDCLEVMRDMPDDCVDLVLTDPPYGVHFRGNDWDKTIPPFMDHARRISEKVIVVTGTTTIWDYDPPDWVGCWYRPASSSRSKIGGFSHWSPILFYGKFKFPVDTINLHAIANAYKHGFEHPTPKPHRLMRWLVEYGSGESDIIFDPFFGSGTTGVAAVRMGRHFIGCEISEDYCKIAEKRIQDERDKYALFEGQQ